MFYKIRIDDPNNPFAFSYMLVEADNIRTARNFATERIIDVEKATELELVTAGREGWPIIRASSETTTDDGQQPLDLPTPHAQTADTAEPRQLSTGSAPRWLPPVNAPATDTGD